MLKQEITYTDYNDQEQTDTLYFNLTATEIADHPELKEKVEAMESSLEGPERTLTPQEIKSIFDLVKELIRLSYGVRSVDGKRFIKNEEVWEEFSQSAAYDPFVWSLFENAQNAVNFMVGVLPKKLVAQLQAQQNGQIPAAEVDTRPAWLREGRVPTADELKGASPELIQEAFRLQLQGKQNNLQ